MNQNYIDGIAILCYFRETFLEKIRQTKRCLTTCESCYLKNIARFVFATGANFEP